MSSEEEEHSGEEYSDAETRDVSPPAQKRRAREEKDGMHNLRAAYLDDEAEVSGDDDSMEDMSDYDDSELDESIIDDAPDDVDVTGEAANIRALDREKERKEYAALEEGVERRAARPVAQFGAAAPVPVQEDPFLWRVDTKPGKEQEALLDICHRVGVLTAKGEPVAVYGCVCRPGDRGVIYVEAFEKESVRAACQGSQNVLYKTGPRNARIYSSGFNPPKLPRALQYELVTAKESGSVKPDMVCRVRRGLYSGDLCQVVSVNSARQRAVVRLVPRVGALDDLATSRRKVKTGKRTRPPARLITSEEMERFTDGLYDPMEEVVVGKKRFVGGFLMHVVPYSNLVVDAQPTQREMLLFSKTRQRLAGDEDEEGLEAQEGQGALGALPALSLPKLFRGDKVTVRESDEPMLAALTGERGLVQEVDKEKGVVSVRFTALNETVPFQRSDLRRLFDASDVVGVVSGPEKGVSGRVVACPDANHVVLLTAGGRRVRVRSSLCRARAGDAASWGQLISFGPAPTDVGFLISGAECPEVLTVTGRVVTLAKGEGRVLPWMQRPATDRDGGLVQKGDEVEVVKGERAGSKGVVEATYRGSLFISSSRETFAVPSDTCTAVGKSSSDALPALMRRKHQGRGSGSLLNGDRICIESKNHSSKGMTGEIMHVSGDYVTVRLTDLSVVTVKRTEIVRADQDEEVDQGGMGMEGMCVYDGANAWDNMGQGGQGVWDQKPNVQQDTMTWGDAQANQNQGYNQGGYNQGQAQFNVPPIPQRGGSQGQGYGQGQYGMSETSGAMRMSHQQSDVRHPTEQSDTHTSAQYGPSDSTPGEVSAYRSARHMTADHTHGTHGTVGFSASHTAGRHSTGAVYGGAQSVTAGISGGMTGQTGAQSMSGAHTGADTGWTEEDGMDEDDGGFDW
ncbi:hypothetical protein KIPB_005728 [Kipferlia bialata]|uniref:KOW domain-containing protein n=1 Tax=Kipferlia bialata TaxID=797122 RepID=A0A9K3GJ57_9EUKA|nr:hypothetical protein KIPB_005728 [Kipferlia bialata]|eukprot:g5728.t1